jgi:hypothetical protein
MTLQWSAIPSQELHNTRREWVDQHGRFYASVILMCSWDDRFKLLQDLYTSSYGSGFDGDGGYLPRAYPADIPPASSGDIFSPPDFRKIGVTSAIITTMPERYSTDIKKEVIKSQSTAFIQVQYGRMWNIEESIEYANKLITQEKKWFLWETKVKGLPEDVRLLGELEVPEVWLNRLVLNREFIGLSAQGAHIPDFKKIPDLVGKTNTIKFNSVQLGMEFLPETLLFIEPNVSPSIDMQNIGGGFNNFGNSGFTVKARFLYKPETHNKFWRSRFYNENTQTSGGFDFLRISYENGQTEPFRPFLPDTSVDEWLINASRPILAPL